MPTLIKTKLEKQNKLQKIFTKNILTISIITILLINLSISQITNKNNIAAGSGYSKDTQQITSQNCFSASISSTSGAKGFSKLDEATTFTDIQNSMKFDISTKGGYGMFSANAEASYLREIEEKSFSLSLNYYQYAMNTISLAIKGFGNEALTDIGKSFYQDGKNPYFGIVCGDYYINSYDQGALLLMNLSVELNSKFQKEKFEAEAGGSFGNIFSASSKIEQIAQKLKIQGFVSIQAFQIGGDPAQLGKILSKDSSGNYYILRCNINQMENCKKAADGILNYTNENFSNQFNFEENKGLAPLGPGFSNKMPIYYIGLNPPKTLVDENVEKSRLELSNYLSEAKFYVENFHSLIYGYPSNLIQTSTIYQNSLNLLNSMKQNIESILNYSDPMNSGLGCYLYPDQCVEIKEKIEKKLRKISEEDLKYLEKIKYSVQTYGGKFFRIGDLDTNWAGISNGSLNSVFSISISDLKYTFHTNAFTPDLFDFIYSGDLQADGITFIGNLSDWRSGRSCCEHTWRTGYMKELSPFYFGVYKPNGRYFLDENNGKNGDKGNELINSKDSKEGNNFGLKFLKG